MEEKRETCKPVVNVKEAIKSSDNKFLRNLPGFVIRTIARTVREKELNEIHLRHCKKSGIEYVKALIYDEFNIKITTHGNQDIKPKGRYVYVANHPLGAIDALAFLLEIHNIHGNVVSPSNQLFNYIPNLDTLLLGVNVFGTNTKEVAEQLNKLFESDIQVMIFPAGEVSREINGKIQDTEWKKTFVTKSLQYKRDIIPVFISAVNSKKFYRTAKWRKRLGIKNYIETLLLPQELLKKKNAHIDIYFGEAITYEEMKNSGLNHKKLTQKIRKKVYSLANQKKL